MDWTRDAIDAIANDEEVGISSDRADGSPRPFVIVWAVVVDGHAYIRSAYGPDSGWYRRAVASGTGRIRAADIETAVRFERPEPDVNSAIDDAYLAKYAHYPKIIAAMVGRSFYDLTLRLDPIG